MKARIGDIDIHYQISGQGPWITLSHSLAAHGGMWAPQVALLKQHFTVLNVDTRGHGQTDAPPGPYRLEQLADDVQGLLAHLGVARTHWLGLSMGGMIGQVLALRHPQALDRVVLADTTGQGAPSAAQMWADRAQAARASGMAALVEPTLARWFTEPTRQAQPALMAEVGAMIAGTPVEGYAGCCAAIAGVDTLEGLRALRHPALVLVGDQDLGTPPAMAQRIAEHWPGAQCKVLAGAAHLANLEQPEAFNREVLGFLLAPGRN
jgi:3-oxoadipate enol-lactonase